MALNMPVKVLKYALKYAHKISKIFIQITILLKIANLREFINGSLVHVLPCMDLSRVVTSGVR